MTGLDRGPVYDVESEFAGNQRIAAVIRQGRMRKTCVPSRSRYHLSPRRLQRSKSS
jgi:hypothetical protein